MTNEQFAAAYHDGYSDASVGRQRTETIFQEAYDKGYNAALRRKHTAPTLTSHLELECAMCGAESSFIINPDDPSTGFCLAERRFWTIRSGKQVEGVSTARAEATPPELLPCPFCGCGKVENWASRPPNKDEDIWCVFCHQCLCEGPEKATESKAAQQWNTRADHNAALIERLTGALGAIVCRHCEKTGLDIPALRLTAIINTASAAKNNAPHSQRPRNGRRSFEPR